MTAVLTSQTSINFSNVRIKRTNISGHNPETPDSLWDRAIYIVLDDEQATRYDEQGYRVYQDGDVRCLKVNIASNPESQFVVDGEHIPFTDSGTIDFIRIDHANVVVQPFTWQINGHSGIKAYLTSIDIHTKKENN